MSGKPSLHVGLAPGNYVAAPIPLGCVNVDRFRSRGVHVICDIQHLPFKRKAFQDVFCFHVLEHIEHPTRALSELIRVASRLVEIEVPHRLGRMAKSQRWKRDNPILCHLGSFREMWFHHCLKNFRHCVRILYTFPRDLHLHVWVYLEEWTYIE